MICRGDRAPYAIKFFADEQYYDGCHHHDDGTSLSSSSPKGSVPAPLRETERQQILQVLEQTNWHRGKTAEILGISPSTLYRRLRDYNLEHSPVSKRAAARNKEQHFTRAKQM
jgi:DNA-binding NtrC family response regulator